MKKQLFTAMVFIAAIGISGRLAAQEEKASVSKTAGYDLKTNVKARVSATSGGCDVVFSHEVKSPRDASSGMASGKRMHKPIIFSVSSTDNLVTESSSPKSASTGMSAGKVSLSDLSVMISLEKGSAKKPSQKLAVEDGEFSLPEEFQSGSCDVVLSWSWGASNSGSSRCTKTFTVSMQDGQLMAINEKGLSGTKN